MCTSAQLKARLWGFMHYESVKYIRVNNWTIGILFWLMTFGLIGYIIGYQIVVNKGYQRYDQALGTAQIKVKGAVSTGNATDGSLTIFDANDVVLPPLEHDALFIQTNYIYTGPQRRGTCEGNDGPTESCSATDPCLRGDYTVNGVNNGTCAPSGYCFVDGWCPPEDDEVSNENPIDHVGDMTLYVRINALFPSFGIAVQSLPFEGMPQPFAGLGAGVIVVDQLLGLAGVQYAQIQRLGGILLMAVTYDCDLNYDPATNCKPTFRVDRIDNAAGATPGMNYRYTDLSTGTDGEDQRDLYKVWGMRLVVYVSGKGGKFDTAALAVTIGAGIGLLSVAGLVCDFFLSSCARKKAEYNARRVELVVDADAHPTDEVPEGNFRALADERAAATAAGRTASPSRV